MGRLAHRADRRPVATILQNANYVLATPARRGAVICSIPHLHVRDVACRLQDFGDVGQVLFAQSTDIFEDDDARQFLFDVGEGCLTSCPCLPLSAGDACLRGLCLWQDENTLGRASARLGWEPWTMEDQVMENGPD